MIYVFGACELDTQICELRRSGVPVQLAPKVYQVLVYLLQHRDRLVAKEELLEHVWPGTYVDDSAVARCVMAIRRAIAADGKTSPSIKTLRGQGYRFIAPVTPYATPPGAEAVFVTHPSPGTSQQVTPSLSLFSVEPVHTSEEAPAQLLVGSRHAMPSAATPQGTMAMPSYTIGERKLVTALYCAFSSALGKRHDRDLDDLHNLVQTVYALAWPEIEGYGGTMQALNSEGLLAVFGIPQALEDHAQRAVLAAFALRQQFRAHEQAPSMVQASNIRMALYTGFIVIGQVGHGPHHMPSMVGEAMLLAPALACHADPGTILASEATLRLVPHLVRLEESRTLALDGLPLPVSVARIEENPSLFADGVRARQLWHNPFVGRETELAMLLTRLHQAQDGYGQVVGIVGEPGMGKSRLLHELHQRLADKAGTVLQGYCQPFGTTIPYLPLRNLLRTTWGLADAENPGHVTAILRHHLRELAMEPDVWLPYLLRFFGTQILAEELHSLDATAIKERSFEALHRIFLAMSQAQPLVLVIEDLHWIDATSEAYLGTLVERLAGSSLLLLVTYRPGYRPAWSDKSYATQLALQPLGAADSGRLLQGILRHRALAAPTAQQIIARAEGNPLFLEELAQAADEYVTSATGGPLPDTIQAVLAARVDLLSVTEKRLLQTAAVLGREISVPLLQTLTGLAEQELQGALSHLQDTEFLREVCHFPEHLYTFKHTLTQEVAYGTMLLEQRRALHIRLVDILENPAADGHGERLEQLARHALGGELWEKAHAYFRQAGLKALACSAYREAAACFTQALTCLQHAPQVPETRAQAIDLRLDLRNALLPLGDNAQILRALQEAAPLAEALQDDHRLGWISCYLSTHAFIEGDFSRALETGERAYALAQRCRDVTLQIPAQLHLAQAQHALGNYRQAVVRLRQIIGMTGAAVHTRAWLVWCLAEMGDFAEALTLSQSTIALVENSERGYDLVPVYGTHGYLALRQGNTQEAISYLERALSICQATKTSLMWPTIAAKLGTAYVQAGRVAEGLALLEQAVALTSSMHLAVYQTLQLCWLGDAHRLAQHHQEALDLAWRGLDMARRRREQGHEAYLLQLLGAIHAQQASPAEQQAETLYQQAMRQARALEMRPLLAQCTWSLGELYCRLGRQQQAQTAFTQARDRFRALGMTGWLTHTRERPGSLA